MGHAPMVDMVWEWNASCAGSWTATTSVRRVCTLDLLNAASPRQCVRQGPRHLSCCVPRTCFPFRFSVFCSGFSIIYNLWGEEKVKGMGLEVEWDVMEHYIIIACHVKVLCQWLRNRDSCFIMISCVVRGNRWLLFGFSLLSEIELHLFSVNQQKSKWDIIGDCFVSVCRLR